MRKEKWIKGLVLSIIILCVGASIVPIIIGSTTKKTNDSSPRETFGLQTTWKFFSLNTENGGTTKASSFHPDELSTTSFKPENTPQTTRGSSQLLVDNASISQPMNNDVLRGGDVIEIQGTANGSTFQYYIIEWGVGEYPTIWFTTDIELENDGLLPVVDDTLGTWDTSFVEDEEFLTLRLTVNFSTYTSQAYIRNMCLDPTLKEGWPIRIPFYYDSQGGYYYSLGYLEPVVADINNDGYGEVIIYRPAIPQQLQVYTSEGSLLWSSDVGAPESGNGGNVMLPVIDDINHDGFVEIIVYRFLMFQNYCELYVFDHNGSVLDGWPIQLPKEYHPTVLCADVNIDGYNEIIFKGNDAWDIMLSIVDYTGAILAQWALPDIHWGAQLVSTPAVGNLDDDPELEIVCGSPSENAGYNSSSGEWINEGFLTVFNIDGTVLPGWPKYTDGIIFSSPATGDINYDGQCEIIVGLMFAGNAPDYRYGGLYVYDANGNVLPGFPFEKGWNFWSAPGLADFDKDGDLEIACSRLGFYSYVIHHDGTLATGWPQQTTWNDYYSSIIGDITNDGVPDILCTAGDAFYPNTQNHGGVYAWKYDGTPILGFPKGTENDAQAPATIADMDNDGVVEIIASSNWDYDWVTSTDKYRGSLYVWEVDNNYNQSTMEWPTFHHDLQRSGMYPRSLVANANGPYEGVVGESVQFFGTASGGSAPYSWWWDFGDGNTSTLEDPTHTYTAPGLYDVTLTVIDDVGAQATDTTTANITLPVLFPVLEIGTPTGGFGVKASIKNTGEVAATNVVWEIALDGKLIFIGKSTTDAIASLAVGADEAIKSKFIFGFGKTNIVISATCDEGISAEVTKTAFVLGPFLLGVK
jgi:hypothetical protein